MSSFTNSPNRQPQNLKDKINIAYTDLETLQNELKKLKTSALNMNVINEKLDRSLDKNDRNNSTNLNQTTPNIYRGETRKEQISNPEEDNYNYAFRNKEQLHSQQRNQANRSMVISSNFNGYIAGSKPLRSILDFYFLSTRSGL